jgi:hypothetical protein
MSLPTIHVVAALKHTGPVRTLADFVVHVPTSCGSMAMAVTVEIKYAIAASSDLNEGESIVMVTVEKSGKEHEVKLILCQAKARWASPRRLFLDMRFHALESRASNIVFRFRFVWQQINCRVL